MSSIRARVLAPRFTKGLRVVLFVLALTACTSVVGVAKRRAPQWVAALQPRLTFEPPAATLPETKCSTPADQRRLRAETFVNDLFLRYVAGDFPDDPSPLLSGWTMPHPSGESISRSRLQYYAKPIIAMRAGAAPHLFRWVMADNPAVRYIAVYSLERITGIKYGTSYFDPDPDGTARNRAIRAWEEWLSNLRGVE
jgi:hypothetical protein